MCFVANPKRSIENPKIHKITRKRSATVAINNKKIPVASSVISDMCVFVGMQICAAEKLKQNASTQAPYIHRYR